MKHYLLGLILFFCTPLCATEELFHGIDVITGKIVIPDKCYEAECENERVVALESSRDHRTAFTFAYQNESTTIEDASSRRYCYTHDGSHITSKKVWDSSGLLFSHEAYVWAEDALISAAHYAPDGSILFQKKIEQDENSILTTIVSNNETSWEKIEYQDKKIVSRTDHLGRTVRYIYNPEGLLVAELKSSPQKSLRQFFIYNDEGHLIEFITDDGVGTDTFDFTGMKERKRVEIIPSMQKPEVIILYRYNPESATEIVEKRIEGIYNAENNLIFEDFFDSKHNESKETFFNYDSLGHLTLLHDGKGNGIESSYDPEHHLLSQTVLEENTPVKSSIYTYDENDHPSVHESVNSKGETTSTQQIFNALNQMIATIDSHGNRTDYEYNPQGLLTTLIQPAVIDGDDRIIRPTYTWIYDSFGNLISFSDANGEVISNTQNLRTFNPWTPRTHPLILPQNLENATIRLFTDSAGSTSKKITIPEASGDLTTYTCDALDRVTEIETLSLKGDLIKSEKMAYDPVGNPVKYSWLDLQSNQWVSSTWTIGSAGKIERFVEAVSTPLQRTTTYQYDSLERLESITKPDGTSITFTYNEKGALSHLVSSDGTINQPFEVDELIVKQHDDQNKCVGYLLPDGSAVSYSWDGDSLKSIYRLDQNGSIVYEFSSDKFILEEKSVFPNSKILEESHDLLFQLQSYGKRHYEYDINGNIKTIVTPTEKLELQYDALDRLTSISNGDGLVWTYRYDGHNRRIERIVTNQQEKICHDYFLYDGTKEIGVMRDGKIVQFRLLDPRHESEIGATIAIELEDQILRPIHDNQKNIRRLTALNGEEVSSYRYDQWRERTPSDHELNCPWRYRGKRVDDESGLIFFGRRFYMPYEGRWLTPDPMGHMQEANRYAYCHNHPNQFNDHYGLFTVSDVYESVTTQTFQIHEWIQSHLSVEKWIIKEVDFVAHQLFSNAWLAMLGYYNEDAGVHVVGSGELNNKVRVTIINGMLNMHEWAEYTALEVSKTHADINVHYVYRPTRGWMHDLIKATFCKFGYVSHEAQLLGQTWLRLIDEMGGPEGGGTIVHYAHSIGAADTYSARLFLSPEQQKMIKVISLGSPLVIPHEGFGSVINYISVRDGVRHLALFAQKHNVVYLDSYWGVPVIDHLMNSGTYKTLIENLGRAFIKEYFEEHPESPHEDSGALIDFISEPFLK